MPCSDGRLRWPRQHQIERRARDSVTTSQPRAVVGGVVSTSGKAGICLLGVLAGFKPLELAPSCVRASLRFFSGRDLTLAFCRCASERLPAGGPAVGCQFVASFALLGEAGNLDDDDAHACCFSALLQFVSCYKFSRRLDLLDASRFFDRVMHFRSAVRSHRLPSLPPAPTLHHQQRPIAPKPPLSQQSKPKPKPSNYGRAAAGDGGAAAGPGRRERLAHLRRLLPGEWRFGRVLRALGHGRVRLAD